MLHRQLSEAPRSLSHSLLLLDDAGPALSLHTHSTRTPNHGLACLRRLTLPSFFFSSFHTDLPLSLSFARAQGHWSFSSHSFFSPTNPDRRCVTRWLFFFSSHWHSLPYVRCLPHGYIHQPTVPRPPGSQSWELGRLRCLIYAVDSAAAWSRPKIFTILDFRNDSPLAEIRSCHAGCAPSWEDL